MTPTEKPKKSNADSQYIWMDGEYVPYADAKVHILSHSLHYGTGAFEGIRAYKTPDGKTAIFALREHLERFVRSAAALGFEMPCSVDAMHEACINLVRKNNFQECYLRPLAYLDDSFRGLKLPQHPSAHVAIASWEWGKYLGSDAQQKGIRCKISTYRRGDAATSMSHAKLSGAYLTPVLARREASLSGFDEAILLDPQGLVAEGSGENIFLIKDRKIITPPPNFILPGITRDCVMQIASDLGMPVTETTITRNQLYLADELFFTGTAVEVTPIREIDWYPIGKGAPGPVTRKILDTFFRAVRGEEAKYKSWLTIV